MNHLFSQFNRAEDHKMADYSDAKWREEAWRIRRAKLGVALAVIRSRPAGKSGRQHAEYLTAKLKEQEEQWKRKAVDLKEEVLNLKQELVLTNLLNKQRNGAETARGDDVLKLLSQDLTEAQLSGNDSGCDTQTLSLASDPADAVLSSSVAPPRSPRPRHPSFHKDTRDCVLSKHMLFLQNLCALRASGKDPLTDRGDAVLEDTALSMIESLAEAHREAGGGRSGDASQLGRFVQASRLAARALETVVDKRKVLEKAEQLLEELLELLLNNSQLNKFAVQDNLSECLICLGGASVLRPVLVHLVLTRIIRLAEQLWSACQEVPEGQQPPQVDWVSRSLEKYQKEKEKGTVLTQISIRKVTEKYIQAPQTDPNTDPAQETRGTAFPFIAGGTPVEDKIRKANQVVEQD